MSHHPFDAEKSNGIITSATLEHRNPKLIRKSDKILFSHKFFFVKKSITIFKKKTLLLYRSFLSKEGRKKRAKPNDWRHPLSRKAVSNNRVEMRLVVLISPFAYLQGG